MFNREKFLKILKKQGVSAKDLAISSGMPRSRIYRNINGKSAFRADDVKRICRRLGITDDREKAEIFFFFSS